MKAVKTHGKLYFVTNEIYFEIKIFCIGYHDLITRSKMLPYCVSLSIKIQDFRKSVEN